MRITATSVRPDAPKFKINDRVTDGLVRGTVAKHHPERPMVSVRIEPWPGEVRYEWMSEDGLRLETPGRVRE